MNSIERKRIKRLKRKQKKAKRAGQRKSAHIWSYGTNDHVEYVKVQIGKKESVYHTRNYDDPEALLADVVDDLKHRNVVKVYQHDEVRPPEPVETLARCVMEHLEFNGAVRCLADAAEGFESWEQVQASLEETDEDNADAALDMAERFKDKLTVMEFCELANDEDSQKRWIESGGKEPLNYGLDKLKDVYCGKTKAERMITVDPSAF